MTKRIERVAPEHLRAVLAAARREYPVGNPYGVRGFLVAPKRRGGKTLRYSTLQVCVVSKERTPRHPVEPLHFRAERQSYLLQPDVVGVGSCTTHPARGARANFSGLHPGAAIRVGNEIGALSVLLGRQGATEPSHLLTAGHVFAPGGTGRVHAALDGSSGEIEVGVLDINLLDTGDARDGALVELSSEGRELAGLTRAPGPAGDPSGIFPAAAATEFPRSQMYRPTAGDATTIARPERQAGLLVLDDAHRGTVTVESPIVAHVFGEAGDSGSLLRTVGSDSLAVGCYSGRVGGAGVFNSVSGLLRALRQEGAPRLHVWRPV